MTLEPLVTVSWIWEIWQGVSSLVLQASVVQGDVGGVLTIAYFLAPAIMASQKPPVALVIRVTLMGPAVALAAMLVGAELVPTAVVADGVRPRPLVGAVGALVAAGAAAFEVATAARRPWRSRPGPRRSSSRCYNLLPALPRRQARPVLSNVMTPALLPLLELLPHLDWVRWCGD